MLKIVAQLSEPQRADVTLRTVLAEDWGIPLSRSSVKALFGETAIRLDPARPSLEASTLLGPGEITFHFESLSREDLVRFSQPALARALAPEHPRKIEILFENQHVLVILKPSGLPSVPHTPEETETAVGLALRYLPELSKIGRGGLEPAILHRLDTGTSGALVFAKSSSTFERLRAAWSTTEVKKTYRALVRKTGSTAPPLSPQTLTWPMGHDAKSSRKMRVLLNIPTDLRRIRGNPLETHTEILLATLLNAHLAQYDVEVLIQTGVMHQIRAHLSALGYPLQGDPIYGGAPASRLWLHAWKIQLPGLPEIIAPLPESWPTSRTA